MQEKKIKLLIVDDEKDICKFEKEYLEKHNYKVSTAETGQKAIAISKREKPDIALIDIYMSKGIDGIEILQKILEVNPECKCIMSSWDKAKAIEAKTKGAIDILIKPAEIKDLEKIVNKIAAKLTKK